MQLDQHPQTSQHRRLIKRRVVHKYPPPRHQRAKLKLGNLLLLVTGITAFIWGTTLPFRQQSRSRPPTIIPHPLAVTSQPSQPQRKSPEFIYNVTTTPPQIYDQTLQDIVDQTIQLVASKNFPTEPLSITLIDVSDPHAHTFAGYQNQVLRFPASVAKLFWMVAFYEALDRGMIANPKSFNLDLERMMSISDNDGASRILDAITQTESGPALSGEALTTFLQKRFQINQFFRQAGYENIRLSTKNYPIYQRQEQEPTGRDLQVRENDSFRNQVTTDHAARILYEIYTRQAVSPQYSAQMAYLLTRDLNPRRWRNDPISPIKGFLGEPLPPKIYFGSKVGYTSKSRQEVAFIRTLDDRAMYIVVVFAEDPAYAKDDTIFPTISEFIFTQMLNRP